MYKVEKMHIADIIDETNLYLTPQSLCEIWKSKDAKRENPKKPTAWELISQNENLLQQLNENDHQLYNFLLEHDSEIDKIKFVMVTLRNFKERLGMEDKYKISSREKRDIQEGIDGIKRLLKDVNETYVFYNIEDETNKIIKLMIINSAEEVEGKDRKSRNSNAERLMALEEELDLGDVAQGIMAYDFEYTMAFDPKIGAEMRYMAEYNTIINEYGSDFSQMDPNLTVTDLASKIDRVKFIGETIRTLWLHIEEVNMDKMLLCAAYRYIDGFEEGEIKEGAASEVKNRLEIIRRHIKKNATITIYPDVKYSLRDFDKDLKRFVGKDENARFLRNEEIQQLKDALVTGKITLTSLGKQNFEAISIEPSLLAEVLRKNPNNYIFFLREEKCAYNKNTILGDIRNTQNCSTDLLKLLCEKTDITAEEVRELFDREIISVSDLVEVREMVGTIITDEILLQKYNDSKTDGNEDSKIQLERYALAYRNTELAGRTNAELEEKGEEFITNVGEEIEPSDLVPLYGLDIIPLKTAVDWGGDNIIEELVESESLKPADARHLRDEGLLDEKVLERLFKKCTQMSYSYQVALVFAVFDGQTPEEQEIREQLAQYYHIENSAFKTSTKGFTGKRRNSRTEHDEQETQRVKMRDPGAKYNLLAAIDKDVKIEEGIIDGHIIFHYPNIDGGTVLIEKLHKIRTNKENGLIEIKSDNEAATYVLSEEEFIKLKSQLIKEGKVDRTELTQRWWVTRNPEHWIPHAGTSAWEKAIMKRFNIQQENSRYSTEELSKIEQLVAKSIDSKER